MQQRVTRPKRPRTIGVRVSEEEMALLGQAAARRGLPVSLFMRMVTLEGAQKIVPPVLRPER